MARDEWVAVVTWETADGGSIMRSERAATREEAEAALTKIGSVGARSAVVRPYRAEPPADLPHGFELPRGAF